MNGNLNVSSSPHVKDDSSTRSIMLDVCIALLPAVAFGVYNFGWYTLIIVLSTVAAAVVSEFLWEYFMKKKITICDCSAIVTGLILSLNMPPQIPVWIPVIGAVFAIIIIKQLYGGLGQNWMNPALGARCFLVISFAGHMTDFTCSKLALDAVSSATPLALMKQGIYQYTPAQLFFGFNMTGCIGEVSKCALLIGAVYLVIRKVIDLKIPLITVAAFGLFALFYSKFDFYFTLCQILSGGLIFGAFYMANDYVTSPITPNGQILYAAVIGLIAGALRFLGDSTEGLSYAIIICNMLVPLIEKITLPVAFGKEGNRS